MAENTAAKKTAAKKTTAPRRAAKKTAAKPAAKPDEPKVVLTDAKVSVEDHASAQRERLAKEAAAVSETRRAEHVAGLRNELEYLKRQPSPNKRRVAEVEAELDRYAEQPSRRQRETA